MARFAPILAQKRSDGLWEASGMPPGPPNPWKYIRIIDLGFRAPYSPYLSRRAVAETFNNAMQRLRDVLGGPMKSSPLGCSDCQGCAGARIRRPLVEHILNFPNGEGSPLSYIPLFRIPLPRGSYRALSIKSGHFERLRIHIF